MLDGKMGFYSRRQTAPMADRGTTMNVVSWILLAVVLCTLIARFAMKLSMKTTRRRLGLDDLFIALAALASFGQTIAVSVEATYVLGQHATTVTPHQKNIFQKTEYAACMLYIANMGCARISVCLLIRKVLPGIVARNTALAFTAFTGLWTVSGILVTAFPCPFPRPWQFVDNKSCYDVVTLVNYIGITNIVVEVLLVMIPLVVWNVRLSAGRRVSVSLVFLARLSIVAAVAPQLYFLNNAVLTDFSYGNWTSVLCQQIAQNLSVISACLPCLHPFIISILAGTTEPETISIKYSKMPCVSQYIKKKPTHTHFDSTESRASQLSTTPLTDKNSEPYCRPLATYGLDRSSLQARNQSTTRFPANVAKPVFFAQESPENVFNRAIEVPVSRPGTSTSATDPLAVPKNLCEVGVLPMIDWDSESNASSGSRRSSPCRSRTPTAEYIFNRQKVISVPEEVHIFEEGHKKYAPLPSPRRFERPPRLF